jgi:hypothetical protein
MSRPAGREVVEGVRERRAGSGLVGAAHERDAGLGGDRVEDRSGRFERGARGRLLVRAGEARLEQRGAIELRLRGGACCAEVSVDLGRQRGVDVEALGCGVALGVVEHVEGDRGADARVALAREHDVRGAQLRARREEAQRHADHVGRVEEGVEVAHGELGGARVLVVHALGQAVGEAGAARVHVEHVREPRPRGRVLRDQGALRARGVERVRGRVAAEQEGRGGAGAAAREHQEGPVFRVIVRGVEREEEARARRGRDEGELVAVHRVFHGLDLDEAGLRGRRGRGRVAGGRALRAAGRARQERCDRRDRVQDRSRPEAAHGRSIS